LWVPGAAHIQVVEATGGDAFNLPVQSAAVVRRYDLAKDGLRRLLVRGQVSGRQSRQLYYLQDHTGGVFVQTEQPVDLAVGATVEAVGLPLPGSAGVGNLHHAMARALATSRALKVAPRQAGAAQLTQPECEAQLVSLRGELVSQTMSTQAVQLVMTADQITFSAALESAQPERRLPRFRPGTVLELTGFCPARNDPRGAFGQVHLWLRSPADVMVVAEQPWFTTPWARSALAGAGLVFLLGCAWVFTLRRQVQAQTRRLQVQHAREAALERQILQTQRLESLGVLAGGIAHDFNNLLTTILGNLTLAREDVPPATATREMLEEAERAAQRAAHLVRQMMAYAGKSLFKLQRLDLRQAIEEMRPVLPLSVSARAELRFELAPDLPMIEADPVQLRQMLTSLVTNASEALGDQGGRVLIAAGLQTCERAYLATCWLAEASPEGPYVFMQVADTGCGIAAEDLSRVFDPFFSTKFTGRGLGLPAVLGMVRNHKGVIHVRSQPGQGATFTILFPVPPPSASQA
jgi:signal transduction histidine kinase